jgi:hypothetical protein
MRNQVVARYPRGGLFVMLLIALFADYLCFDLRYVHAIRFSSGINAQSPWFWPIFGCFLGLTLHCLKQVVIPSVLMRAGIFGLELRHRVLKPAIRLHWEDVHEIAQVQKEVATQKGTRLVVGVRFGVKTPEQLNGVISGSVDVDGDTIFFDASLFDRDLNEIVATLREIRASALGPGGRTSS